MARTPVLAVGVGQQRPVPAALRMECAPTCAAGVYVADAG
jgi:hypothetical protein